MKSILFFVLLLLVVGHSYAQVPAADTSRYFIDKCKIRGSASVTGTIVKNPEIIPGGTPANCGELQIRNGRGDCYYYIDGIKVNGQLTDSIADSLGIKDVQIITGGLPINFGDLNSSVIRITKTTDCVIPRKLIVSDKEQKMATE